MTSPEAPMTLPPEPPRPPHRSYWSITYHTPLGFGVHIHVHLFGGSSERPACNVDVRANWRRGQEIGYYRRKLPDERLEPVRQLVSASNFETHAHRGPTQPDTPRTGLGFNPNGDPFEFSSFVVMPPERVSQAMRAIEDVAGELLDHPFIAITGQGRWLQERIAPGRSLDFEVTFGARGEQPPGLRNPLAVPPSDLAHMYLTVKRDSPEERLHSQKDVSRVELLGSDVSAIDGRRGGPDPIRISPGTSFTIRGHKRLYLSPGRYRGELVYVAAEREWNETERWVVPGRLTIDLGTIEISGSP